MVSQTVLYQLCLVYYRGSCIVLYRECRPGQARTTRISRAIFIYLEYLYPAHPSVLSHSLLSLTTVHFSFLSPHHSPFSTLHSPLSTLTLHSRTITHYQRVGLACTVRSRQRNNTNPLPDPFFFFFFFFSLLHLLLTSQFRTGQSPPGRNGSRSDSAFSP